MTSLGTFFRRTSLALVAISAAACGDNVTQGTPQSDTNGNGSPPAASVTNSNEKPPVLLAQSNWGTASDLSDGPLTPGSRLGYFFRVTFTGAGFPPGADYVSRTYGVTAGGSKVSVSMAIGVIPADGTTLGAYGASCPSGFVEMYEVGFVAGRTVESNHAPLGC